MRTPVDAKGVQNGLKFDHLFYGIKPLASVFAAVRLASRLNLPAARLRGYQ
jgi:hypothetical protein